MRPYVYILALVLHQSLLLCNALPPTYSGEPPILGDSGGGSGGVDYGGSTQKQPNLGTTYITSSSTSSSSSSSTTKISELSTSTLTNTRPTKTSSSSTAATATTTKATTSAPTATKLLTTNSSSQTPASAEPTLRMEPAFAYEAAVPEHREPNVTIATNSKRVGEIDGDSSKKIIGSSVVTSVSVILNGNEPQFTDALGHKVPKPQPSLQVASPINLLNPDRYEFYTFDDNGELVKRLMTMQEIQSIVANGDGEGPSIIHTAPVAELDPEKNVQDIVNSVQNVLNKEVESTKNSSIDTPIPILDTPDVSSSWSMILPAIFGNTGGGIFPQQKPQQIVMTPDSELLETSTKVTPTQATRATKKPKPAKRKPGHKRKPTTSAPVTTPQVVQEELAPNESVYTGMQQYQNLASNMQNFDAFSTMHMQPPMYHRQPIETEAEAETTTRRVFVNNQEMIQTTSEMRPATSTIKPELSESNAKKPAGVNTKHQPPPHRNKLPNGTQSQTSKRPGSTGHTKQKVKKKTTPAPEVSTTESVIIPEEPEPTSTTTTTTTTTTPPSSTTTIAPSTVSSIDVTATTQKKKKKKPTRQPGQKPHGEGEKRKPGQRPKPVQRPQQQLVEQQQTDNNKRRPGLNTEASSSGTTQQNTYVNHHKQRPRPTVTTTTTTTPVPTSTTTVQATTPEEISEGSYVVVNAPNQADYSSTVHNIASYTPAPLPAYPVPSYDSSLQKVQPTSDYISENVDSGNLKKKPLPSLSQIQGTPTLQQGSMSTFEQTPQQTAAQPMHQEESQMQSAQQTLQQEQAPQSTQKPTEETPQEPKFPLEQVSQTHQVQPAEESKPQESMQQPQTPQTTHQMPQSTYQIHEESQRPIDEDDQNTKLSFDQIILSLQENDKEELEKPAQETMDNKEQSKMPTIKPIQYDSAETMDKLEEIANKRKKPVPINTMSPPFVVATTMLPPAPHYGGSTLSTMLSEETSEVMTSHPQTQAWATDSASTEDTTTTSSEELNTPVVVITARPQYTVSMTTTMPAKVDPQHFETEATSIPLSQPMEATEKVEPEAAQKEDTLNPTTQKEPETVTAAVTNYQPLYAEIQEPIVTEITTEVPTPVNSYDADEQMGNTQVFTTSESTNDVKKIGSARLPVKLPQKVETLIANGDETSEQPPLVVNLKPHLNLEVLQPTEQIAMSEFQTQAATVASTLVDGTFTLAGDSFMSSNETKDELSFLINDVLKQITNHNPSYKPAVEQEDSNRLTNFAQLNSSFLLKPALKPAQAAISSHGEVASTAAMDSTTKATVPAQHTKDETFYEPLMIINAPQSSTQQPPLKEASKPSGVNVDQNKSEPTISTAIVMMDKDKPDPIYKPLPMKNVPEVVHMPQAIEPTTIIPSKEDIIKKEEAFLNQVKQQLSEKKTGAPVFPEELMESTTFKVPLLSLSQIYAQQQQEEDDQEAQFEAEREKLTAIQEIPEVDHKTIEETVALAPTTADEAAEELTATMTNGYETSDENDATEQTYTEVDSLESESTETAAAAIANESLAENEPTEEPEQAATTPALELAQEIYAEMVNGHQESTEKDSNEQLYATLLSESEEASTEKQSTESGYTSMINESDSAASGYTDKIQTAEEANASLSEMNSASSSENQPALEYDSITNAAQPEPQYAASPSVLPTPAQIDVKDDDSEKQQVTEASVQIVHEKVSESTEIPGFTAIVFTDSDMMGSSEQNTENLDNATEKNEQSTELSLETDEDLSATISTEDLEEASAEPEDPYIKLGEMTKNPEAIKETEVKVQPTLNLPQLPKPTEPQAQPEHLQNSYDPNVNQYQAPMPALSYGQTFDQADEENEDDQLPYQAAASSSSSTSTSTTTTTTTTTKKTTPRPTIRITTTTTSRPTAVSTTKRLNTLKPVSYYKNPTFTASNQAEQPPRITIYNAGSSLPGALPHLQLQPPKVSVYNTASGLPAAMPPAQQRPMHRPPALSNLMHTSTQATRPPVKLEPSPTDSKGLEASITNLDEDVLQFARLCNELAFSYWKSITSEKISSARSLVISPFALTSMLSMVFLGARGSTSGEMNEVLKLDDMVTFNPHLVFKNITETVEKATDSDIATTAFVREVFSDRANGKILQFFKEKTQQLYAGHVEEVNFHVVNDIIRRRTNLLVKRHTMGKVLEYLRTNSVWVNGPLATISANLFQTDCSRGSTHDRDGEMFFQVNPSVRQRRLIPIPAVLYKNGFTAGYEPRLDATVVAFGRIEDTVSTIYVMPGHQSSVTPTDNLDRLERELTELAFTENAWSKILTSLMDRPDMEVQLPRFSHRSFVNASLGLQKMGLKGLFKSDLADLRGLTGSSNRDIYLSDMIQINTFSTCGEDKISDHHHVEMYPAPPLRKRNKDVDANEDDDFDSSEAIIDFGSLVQESALGRGFYDDLLDPKFLELPLPLRPRQARVPDSPRLRFDKPFLYFVRHNPTGMILFMGRFNPRLLP